MKKLGFREKLNKLSNSKRNLEKECDLLIEDAQASCPHNTVVKYHKSACYDYLLCTDCGLSCDANSLSCLAFPKLNTYSKNLLTCNEEYYREHELLTLFYNDCYILKYPMRHLPKTLNNLMDKMGEKLFLRYISKEEHIAFNGSEEGGEIKFGMNLDDRWYRSLGQGTIMGKFSKSYLEFERSMDCSRWCMIVSR